jgi:hypothetical protein
MTWLPARSRSPWRQCLQAKKITLVEPVSRDTHDESYADIPDGKRARHYGYKPLAFVLAYITGAES